jgi:hypothetical protein
MDTSKKLAAERRTNARAQAYKCVPQFSHSEFTVRHVV